MNILELLNGIIKTIKNISMANVISLISATIALTSLFLNIFFNIKNNKRYINSLKPLLSFKFYQDNSLLLLSVKNTGKSEAKNIKLDILEMDNNGASNELMLDDLFKNVFMLYPNEEVQGMVGIYGERIDVEAFPKINIKVSYVAGNDNKKVNYVRTISFKKNIDKKNELSKIEDAIESISYSSNRLTNYIEGRTLFQCDRIDALPKSSLYRDMKDAINNVEHDNISENMDDEE